MRLLLLCDSHSTQHAQHVRVTDSSASLRLHNVIVAEGNAVPAGERIGYDALEDRERFTVSPGGVVIVPPNHFRPGRRMRRIAELSAQPSG
jgi:glucose-1-phosphate adenylyltransferase